MVITVRHRKEYCFTPFGKRSLSLKRQKLRNECAGRREKARQGRVLRDFQIYGYDFDPDQEALVINPSEAEIVRLIFDWFLIPPPGIRGISGIAQLLTEKGIPTKRGAPKWHRQVVRQILSNRSYIGEFYQNKWQSSPQGIRLRPEADWILISCPPIIDETRFLQVQLRLEKSRHWYAGRESDYLLSGLASCSQCGVGLRGKRCSRKGKMKAFYVESTSRGCGLIVQKDVVEDAVWTFFKELLFESEWGKDVCQVTNSLPLTVKRELLRLVVKEIKMSHDEVILITF